jgi:hypothetical protein
VIRYRIHQFLTDDILAPLYWSWMPISRRGRRRIERWHFLLVDKGLGKLWCRYLGHLPIVDHCGLPAHDLCAWCLTDMPGQAPRRS